MKVRIGFVTNSSSYSSAVVRFDNPVVDEILNRYAKDIDFNEIDTGMWSVLKTSFEENTEVNSESLFHVDEMRDDVSQVQNVGVNSPFGTSILQATCQCSELACAQANSELSFSNR